MLKRVPLDFNWELHKVWYGYVAFCQCSENCDDCRAFAKIKGYASEGNKCPKIPEYEALREPPKGDGFQLWENTSEGSPVSPVFDTLDKLCEWASVNATTFAEFKATAEQWKSMLSEDFVFHKEQWEGAEVIFQ
jgi:hypothetical protein